MHFLVTFERQNPLRGFYCSVHCVYSFPKRFFFDNNDNFLLNHHQYYKCQCAPMQIALRNGDKGSYCYVVVILSVFHDVFFHFRAHRNDLENIPTFLIIALLFMLAGLCPTRGIWCLRIFTAARIVHTLSYLSALSKPRAAGFLIGLVCTIVLGVSVLLSAAHAGSF